jgi:hypothetical protein
VFLLSDPAESEGAEVADVSPDNVSASSFAGDAAPEPPPVFFASLLSSLPLRDGEDGGVGAGGEEINVKPELPRVMTSMVSPVQS